MNNTFRSAILAGIAVGIAGWGYLAYKDIIGAVLFSFGLLTVVNYKLKLYTGTAGFVALRAEDGSNRWFKAIGELLFILLGNITGCLLVALFTRLSPLELGASAQAVLEGRLALGPVKAGLLAIGCGLCARRQTFGVALWCASLHQLRLSTLFGRCLLLLGHTIVIYR